MSTMTKKTLGSYVVLNDWHILGHCAVAAPVPFAVVPTIAAVDVVTPIALERPGTAQFRTRLCSQGHNVLPDGHSNL